MARRNVKDKSKDKNKLSTALAKKDETKLASSEMFADAHLGFEETSQESFAIPFLVILQKNSPQVDEDSGDFIKGAKAGSFFNTATNEIFDSKEGVKVIPCHYMRQMVEWVPRDAGGGFRGSHAPESINLNELERNESGKFILANGNELADTRYHFVLLLTADGPKQAVLSLTSTQIKASKNWMTAMKERKAKDSKGNIRSLPMMACKWLLTSVSQSNDKGNWKGLAIGFEGMLSLPEENNLYQLGKEFHKQVSSGQAKVEQPTTGPIETDLF